MGLPAGGRYFGGVPTPELFDTLCLMVAGAAATMLAARPLRLPGIVAYLVAGLLLGPALGLVGNAEGTALISELGIVLLLFLVGLELDLKKLGEVGPVVLVAGSGQVVLTALAGWGLCALLGFGATEALVLGFALSISSTVVMVKVLGDMGQLDSLHGRIAVGIFLVEDLFVLLALTVLEGLPKGGLPDAWSALGGVGVSVVGVVVLMGGVLLVSRKLLPAPFAWASSSPPTLFVWSLCWCFAVVGVAHALHLSVEMGAFMAGLSLAQLPYTHDLQHRIKPLMNFFVAIFFVSLGLKMDFGGMAGLWVPVAVLSVFVLAVKPLIVVPLVARFGYGEATSVKAAIPVCQVSEFSFILIPIAAGAGLVGEKAGGLLGIVGLVTIAASAYVISGSDAIARAVAKTGFLRFMGAKKGGDPRPPKTLSGHVIVIGMNSMGIQIARALHSRGETVLAIDTDPHKLRGLPCATLHANVEYRAVLEDHGLAKAKLVVSALRIEDANDLIAYRCKEAGVPCAIHAVDLSVMENLLAHNVSYFLLPKVDSVPAQSGELRALGLMEGTK